MSSVVCFRECDELGRAFDALKSAQRHSRLGDRGLDQRTARAQDPLAEERRRREYDSLFASNVVQSPTLATTAPTRPPSARRSTPGTSSDLTAW